MLQIVAVLAAALSCDPTGLDPYKQIPAFVDIVTEPSAAVQVGVPLPIQPIVQILDTAGEVAAFDGIAVTASIASGGGVLGGTTTVLTNEAGQAVFTDLKIIGPVGPRTLQFAGTGLDPEVSDTIDVSLGAPAALTLTTAPSGSVQNTVVWAQQPLVQVRDIGGNALPTSGISVTASLASGNGVVGGTTTVQTSSDGQATFTDLSFIGLAGPHTVQFTSAGLPALTSGTITLNAGPVTQLEIATPPSSSAVSADPFAEQPVVQLRDLSGNASSQSGVAVTASIASGGGTLSGTATILTNGSGQAVFTNLAIIGGAGPRTLQFAASGLPTATSGTIDLAAGAVTQLTITTQPSGSAQNTAVFAQQPSVQLRDGSGVAVSQSGVTVTASIASGGGTLGGTVDVVTNASGLATFSGLSITGTVGVRTLQFAAAGLPAVTSGNVSLTAGSAAQLVVITQPSAGAESGTPLVQQPVVQLRDVSGNNVAVAGVTVTAGIATGGGTLGGTVAKQTNASGQAVFTDLVITGTAGARTLQFTGTSLTTGVSNPINVTLTAATQLVITTAPSGTVQNGVALAQQPGVQLRDAGGNNVSQAGVAVTASIATGGGTLVGTATVLTNGSGVALFTDLAISGTTGGRTLQFAASGLSSATSGTITVTPGAATQLVITGQPSATVQNGVALALQPVVRLRDVSGNDVSQPGVNVTASVASGSGTLGGTTVIATNGSGQATFTNLVITGTTGARTLQFTAGALTPDTSGTINVTAGAASQLTLTTPPSATAQNGVALAQQPVVQLRDVSGNLVNQPGVNVTATIASGGGTLGGVATVATSGTGTATFTNLVITGTLGNRTLQFAASGVTSVTSGTISVSSGPASQITITTAPSATTQSGAVLAQQPVVQLRDASGNAVAQGGVTVTASIASGGGTLGGTAVVATNGSGQASFTDLAIAGTAGGRTLQFASSGLASATSGTITVTASTATQLVITTAPSATAQNTVTLAQQPVVQLRDGSGNDVLQSGVSVTVSIASGGGSLGGTTTLLTNANGQAAFTGLSLTGTVGGRTLQFTSAGLTTATSGTVTLSAGPATQVVITTQPSVSAQNTATFAQQPVVRLRDVSGNDVSQPGITLTASIASGGGTLGGTTAVATDGSGQVSYAGLSITGTVGARTLQFAGAGLTPDTSTAITLTAGAATQIVLTTPPSSSAQNTVAFAQQPVVRLRDVSGNDVSQSGITLTASIASGGGTLGGSAAIQTNASGQVNYAGLSITGTTGARTLQFTGTSLTTATSGSITISAGPATQLAITTPPSASAQSGAAFAQQPVVQLRDASGNAVVTAGVTVTATIASGGGSLGGTAAVLTNGSGQAVYTDLSIAGTAGGRTLQFASSGLTSATSGTVTITASTATQLVITTEPSAAAQNGVAFAQQPVVQLRDGSGNNVSQAGVNVTASVATGGAALGGTLTVATNASGQVTFTNLAITGIVGARTLQFAAAGLTPDTSATVTLAAGAATQVVITTQPSGSAQNGVAFAQQPVVRLRDVSGNDVSQAGVSLTASIASGGGTLGGTTAVATNASGQVTYAGLLITGTVGARTLQFAGAGLTPDTSTTVTLTPGVATKVVITTEPSSSAQNTVAFAQQPVVRIRDVSDNNVSAAGVTITASVASGGGALGGTAGVATNASGQVTYAGLSLTGTTGARTLQFASAGLTPDTSATVTITAGPATQLSITTQPADTARSTVALAQQPVVQLRDVSGNAVSTGSVSVTASVSSGGGAIGGTLSVNTSGTGSATFTNLTLTGTGAQVLQFAAAGVTAATSTPVTLPTNLTSGVAVTSLSGAISSTRWYVIAVPASQTQLVVTTTGGTGNVNLYVRSGQLPSLAVNTCAGATGTNAETCTINSPAAGNYYVLLHGAAAYATVSLTATYSAGAGCSLASPGDADNDRLPDCVETGTNTYVSTINTGTNPNNADTDGDGLKDGDEVLGTTAGLDLPGMGTSPLKKDILLEYDWFDDALECGVHSHRPTANAIAKVSAAFASAIVSNPDGSTGVNVISDYGQGGLLTGGNLIADADGVLTFGVNNAEYTGIKTANIAANRMGYFHYVLMPHRYNATSTSSGQAELPGNDLIVSLYCANSDQNVANTIVHELGHNLLLRHGGNVDVNYKPNYNSVMNYKYQFAGVDTDCNATGNGVLSYSYGTRISLDENNLNETQGVCGGAPALDWNLDSDAVDVGIVADINRSGGAGTGDGLFQVITDYNDWLNLFYDAVRTDADGMALMLTRGPAEIISCPDVPPNFIPIR